MKGILLFMRSSTLAWKAKLKPFKAKGKMNATIAARIRARSLVQVHPGPPTKSPVNTRSLSVFHFPGILIQKPFCQLFANFSGNQTQAADTTSSRQFPGWRGRGDFLLYANHLFLDIFC